MGIWKFKKLLKPTIQEQFRLTKGEGNTPCQTCYELAQLLGVGKVYIKREDLNPTGSFKDRSLAFQLSAHNQEGHKKFALSSSGNAAISAISYSKLFGCELAVFVSNKIADGKLTRLLSVAEIADFDKNSLENTQSSSTSKGNVTIFFSEKPRSEAIKYINKNNAYDLRGSTDDLALVGFKTISFELAKQTENIDSIFIPCSSGTSTVGIYRGFQTRGLKSPAIHIVQTSRVHPIAKDFDNEFTREASSLASAIVDRVASRKVQVTRIVESTKGAGWIINDKEIMKARVMLERNCNIKASADSALALAGLVKALAKDFKINRPVIILSGK